MKKCIVKNAIADLRSEPSEDAPLESQLLSGDPVHLLKEEGKWAYVAAIEQLRFRKELGWHPYPGWVEKTALKTVAALPTLPSPPPEINRQKLVADALQFLAIPYLWGGRCKKGIDCSGLIHLLFRAQNICIPRDAHDQYLNCRRIEEAELQPGDFIFFTPKDKPGRITHILLCRDEESCIEAPHNETGKNVRIFPLKSLPERVQRDNFFLSFGRWQQ